MDDETGFGSFRELCWCVDGGLGRCMCEGGVGVKVTGGIGVCRVCRSCKGGGCRIFKRERLGLKIGRIGRRGVEEL